MIISYIIIVIYILIGYYLFNSIIALIEEDKKIYNIFQQLSVICKIMIFLLFLVFWLPVFVGQMFLLVLQWFAKYYNDMS